ncbi:MAG TPA: OsmC family protein [Anaerolineae bacterium]|nr:OsmC family protein [Anaerolineae bacterium]HQK12540.1 OsmC family protein [Anaerolineae bacterium]
MTNVQVTWTGPGMRMVGDVEGGPAILLDSSSPEYGTHSGPSPMELLLLGLAGCTAMDVISIMAKKRQPMTNLQVKVQAERAATHPKIWTKIHLEYVAYGQGISETALVRAIELSESTYCSVHAMLSKAAEITTSYRIVETPNPSLPGTITS